MPERKDHNEGAIKPCLVCMAPNDADAEFCVDCGSPFGTESALFPGEVITPKGPRLKRLRITRRRAVGPSRTYLCLIWMGNLPVVIAALIGCYFTLRDPSGIGNLLIFWVMVLFVFLSGKILYETTHDYLTLPRKDHRFADHPKR